MAAQNKPTTIRIPRDLKSRFYKLKGEGHDDLSWQSLSIEGIDIVMSRIEDADAAKRRQAAFR